MKLDFKNRWILITGASSGLGCEMARQLANDHGANLILVARRLEKLNQLKAELSLQGAGQIKIIAADLSLTEDIDRVVAESINGQVIDFAILNAGVTYFGKQAALPLEQFNQILQTNIIGTVNMSNQLVKYFEKSVSDSGIMFVTSMAAFFPVPYQAVYSGTKGFLNNFAYALGFELENPKFKITVFAPGGIATEMTNGDSFNKLKSWLMPVEQAAREAIYAMGHKKFSYIPGFTNRIGYRFMRIVPAKFIIKTLSKVYGKALSLTKG